MKVNYHMTYAVEGGLHPPEHPPFSPELRNFNIIYFAREEI